MNENQSVSRYDQHTPGPARPEQPYGETGGAPYDEPAEENLFSWRKHASTLVRYKWLLAVALLLGGVGAYGAWNSIQPDYVAQGSLWIRSDEGSDQQGPITTGGLLDASAWVELLSSYAVLDSVVRNEKLYLQPGRPGDLPLFEGFELEEDVQPGSYVLRVSEDGQSATLLRAGTVIGEAAAGAPIGSGAGFRWPLPGSGLPAAQEVPFSVLTPRNAALRLRGTLQTRLDQGGNFLRVELRGKSPERIARVLNTVLERHVEVAATLKSGSLRERREALAEQLANVEQELRTAERSLEEFRVQTITLPSEGSSPIQPGLEVTQDPVLSNYFQMQVELERLRREQERLQAIHDRAAEGEVSLEMLEMVESVQRSSDLQAAISNLRNVRAERRALLQRYTAEHPSVQDLTVSMQELQEEVIPALVGELIRGLRSEEEGLAERVESSGSDLTEIPPRAIEEARLRRRVTMAEQLYQEVRSRYETTNLAEASSIPDVRILDRAAIPEVPANDERIRFATMIMAGVLGLGLLGALILDRFDPRVRHPDEVERRFGLPFLGVVPTIPGLNARRGPRSETPPEAYEAFRGLRTNLTYAYGSADPLILAVSSPGQGDGKSLVASNLARAFAHLGRKTLLIDGDTRRGLLHRQFDLERKPGLTDFLAPSGHSNGIPKESGHANLDVVPCGSRLSNSPELLSSKRLADAMGDFKSRYEVIIVDTPPLGVGSDAILLSCMTGHLLIVLRSGSTNKDLTRAKLESLRRLPTRVLGIVLNDYSGSGPGSYSHYGYYLPGYETGEESIDEPRIGSSDRPERLGISAGSAGG